MLVPARFPRMMREISTGRIETHQEPSVDAGALIQGQDETLRGMISVLKPCSGSNALLAASDRELPDFACPQFVERIDIGRSVRGRPGRQPRRLVSRNRDY